MRCDVSICVEFRFVHLKTTKNKCQESVGFLLSGGKAHNVNCSPGSMLTIRGAVQDRGDSVILSSIVWCLGEHARFSR